MLANEEIRSLKMLIEQEKETQKKNKSEIRLLQDEIITKQKMPNGVTERHAQFNKQIRILENRLDKVN